MLTGLAVLFETCLKLALTSRNDKTCVVSKSRSHYHIWHVVLVTRGIKDSKLLSGGVESRATNLNSLTLRFFLITHIHAVG